MAKKEQLKNNNKKAQTLADMVSHPFTTSPRTLAQKAADILTSWMGSWAFILFFVVFLVVWIFLNVYAWINHWDPYPFILLNLFLSCLAAIQAPIILMSQNRQSQKDRLRADYDYAVNRKSGREISEIRTQLDRIERKLK
jgi:uncharacterized membrane protein